MPAVGFHQASCHRQSQARAAGPRAFITASIERLEDVRQRGGGDAGTAIRHADLDGAILFFEDVYSPASDVDAALTHLGNAGKLDRVRGVAIGEMAKCEDELFPGRWLQSRSMEDVFEAHFRPRGIPVVFNLPLGHGKHLFTVPLGVTATVDADARTLRIEEPALAAGPYISG